MKLRALLVAMLLLAAQACHAQVAMCMDSYYMYCNILSVMVTGSGQVSSTSAGIACPGMCTGSYSSGSYTLTATPAAGYSFSGWGGDCSGTGTCMVSMDDTHTVSANFSAASPQIVPQTGFWYNPAEGGRGFVIEQHGNNLFIGGFMYDANGNAVWYASGPAAMAGPSSYQGNWQQYGGGQTLTGPFKPSSVINPGVGSITLQFTSATTATVTLPDSRQILLQRFPF
jgi:Divergent InlB B-repeat domain